MPVLARQEVTLAPRRSARWFTSRLLPILGDCRLLWMPMPGDTTPVRSFETFPGRVGTPGASVASQLSQLGRGQQQSFASGSTQYIAFPDTADLSFGTGAADQAVSIVALVNVTDTAVARSIVTKWNTSNQEWLLRILASDKLAFITFDQSAAVQASRISDAVITQGSWRVFGSSYDGTGGATAMNGAVLYQDGAVIASTATNNASYVAMENLTSTVEIGADTAHTVALFDGSMGFVAVCAKNLSAADHAQIAAVCRRYFGVP